MCVSALTYTHIPIPSHTHTRTRTLTHVFTHILLYVPKYTPTHPHPVTHTHSYTYTHLYKHAHTHTQSPTHTRTPIHAHTTTPTGRNIRGIRSSDNNGRLYIHAVRSDHPVLSVRAVHVLYDLLQYSVRSGSVHHGARYGGARG